MAQVFKDVLNAKIRKLRQKITATSERMALQRDLLCKTTPKILLTKVLTRPADKLLMKTALLLLLVSNVAFSDDWICRHEAGKREGNTILACGIGIGMDEGTARHAALNDAKREFQSICEMSVDCREKDVTVDPQRTECGLNKRGVMQCYRLLVITLLK